MMRQTWDTLMFKCAQDPVENHLILRNRDDTILVCYLVLLWYANGSLHYFVFNW